MYVNRITHLTEMQMRDSFRRARGRCCQLACSKHLTANPALLPFIAAYSFLLRISATGEYCCCEMHLCFGLLCLRSTLGLWLAPFMQLRGHRKKLSLCRSRVFVANWSHKYGWQKFVSTSREGGKDEGKWL